MAEMKALLVRIGIDHKEGHWNAPVDAQGQFVYVPIPEWPDAVFHAIPGRRYERRYDDVIPALQLFCQRHNLDLHRDLHFPQELLGQPMHLDADFEYLTYGDAGNKGVILSKVSPGDLLVFYSGLRPVHQWKDNLVYALIGIFKVQEVVPAADVLQDRWHENAHTRRTNYRSADEIVVRADQEGDTSGRFNHCIPIGEWRDGAYRVRQDVLDAWGGLSVKNGFITRNGVPPTFNRPGQFLDWLRKQGIQLIPRNN